MVGLIMRPIYTQNTSCHLKFFVQFLICPILCAADLQNLGETLPVGTMRLHSAITLRNLFTRRSLRIPQNLSITYSPSVGDVSGHIKPSSHYSKSSLSEATSSSSLISRIPNASSSLFHQNQRSYGTDSSGGGSPPDVNKVVDEINLKSAEAPEEIEMAMAAKEMVGRIHSMSDDPSFLSSTINAVVKIFGTARSTEILHPWGTPQSSETTGSGFIIPGRRIITNAHVVTGCIFIRAKKYKSGVMYKANVQAFGHDCDLAILTVEDDRFWDDVNPLRLIDSLPDLSQILHIVGYPSGGDTICITRGIVSRIDVTTYNHSRINTQLPTLQVDAALNSGNSGGPVFVGNAVVGVAFQKLKGKENIGYVIPAPIVNRFVSQVEAGEQETGFCCLGVHLQAMDHLPLREFFSMTESMTGVLVTGEMKIGSARPLALLDIILEVNGLQIQDDGEVVDKNIGLHLNGYIALKEVQETLYFKVLRKREIIDICVKATVLLKNTTTDYPPLPYLKCGPFILRGEPNKGVFISQGLEVGYTSFANRQVMGVNGHEVNTLGEVARCLETIKKYVVIHMRGNKIAVFKKATNKSK